VCGQIANTAKKYLLFYTSDLRL